ncbi:MAG: abortive infection family protein [Acetobacter sp.]|nr:abortive infection family protein [Acetobacter sp.]
MTTENPEKIPDDVIQLLVKIFLNHYPHKEIDRLFSRRSNIRLNDLFYDDFHNDKEDLLFEWFDSINQQNYPRPLDVLGKLIDHFWYFEELHNVVFWRYQDDKNKIQTRLSRCGLSYSETEHCIIKKNEAPSTRVLRDHVEQYNLSSLDRFIQQSLDDIDNNPLSAVLHACSTLESVLKEYFVTHQISYNENSAVLSELWKIFIEKNSQMHPEELKNNDSKKIASGLFNIIHGTESLRNKKSSAHGRSEEESRTIEISPRHARLAIHAVHTLSAYILELGEDQKKAR